MIRTEPMRIIGPPVHKQTISVAGTVRLELVSDYEVESSGNVERFILFDTTVNISTDPKRDCLFVIAGSEINNFKKDFERLIEKYRI